MNRQHPPLPHPSAITWTVSSYSGGGGNCVQAAPHPHATGFILLGDSKQPHQAPLTIRHSTWNAFLHTTVQQPPTTA
ncbi:DUF397 domain-containing protein [Streptomyces albipurpureus]|uniref:DUF397 domain-containing protein n=1 Tax=Streptomyces albipurpureus TaxID=2897419 RepID=A0ABT0V1S9_9ACTN|nr:DUF397 domain-containing protein [Streptomyces sp. CWNU-1]MCM2393518.1 DUF397 domain-containing protein [Streptomyces sp. CWNU-1]